MMSLPLPVRLAAGLVATAVEQARDLPRLVVEFPVTAVSQALQVSMRVQQRVTELAIKGDRALGALRPVEEKPSWATFDDDEPPHRNGASTVTELRPQTAHTQAARPPASQAHPPQAHPPQAQPPQTQPPQTQPPRVSRPIPVAREESAPVRAVPATVDEPAAMPGYAGLSIPQLRAKLRTLSPADLRALLAWEQAHEARPPFVTMLSNRITTVTET